MKQRFIIPSLRTFVLLVFAQLLSLSAPAAPWQPIVCNFTPKEYKGGTQNWEMLMADNGWLYVGNNQGLLEYDGCRWKKYGIWYSSPVRRLAQGPDGCVFAGGTNEFGVYSPDGLGSLVYASWTDSVPAQYRNFGEVWTIAYDNEKLYVVARSVIFIVDPSRHVTAIDPGSIVYASLVQDNLLYVATSNGVYLLSGGRLHMLQGSDLLRGLTISAIEAYNDHSFLIATDFAGLFLWDGTSIRPFRTDVDNFLIRSQLYSVAVGQNSLAFGTVLHGLVVTDKQGRNPVFVDRKQGLQNNTVLSLVFDEDDNLWAGLDQGITLLPLQCPLQYLHSGDVEYGSGYAYAEHGGYSYYGTNQGLYYCSSGSNMMHLIEGSAGQVWHLCEVNGTLFCCHNRGLFAVHAESLQSIPIPEGVWKVLRYSDTKILACTYNGLYLIDKQAGSYHVASRLNGYDETMLYSEIDRLGRIWTISSQGVECLTISSDMHSVERTLVIEDRSRTYYSLTSIGGKVIVAGDYYMAFVNEENGMLEESPELGELFDGLHNYPLMVEDKAHNLIYMREGRLMFRQWEGDHYASSFNEVMNDPDFFVGGFANIGECSDGSFVVGGVEGFYRINPKAMRATIPQATVYFRSVTSDQLGEVYGDSGVGDSLTSISLPAGSYYLHVTFGGSQVNRQQRLFRTRLLPHEEEWSEWTSDPFCDIHLPKRGKYMLEVEMHSTEAENATAVLLIHVATPWYMSWWAWLLYVLLATVLVASIIMFTKYRVRQARRRMAREQEEELREKQLRILQLEREQAQFDLKAKSRELNTALLNQVNRNEIAASMRQDVHRVQDMLDSGDNDSARRLLRILEARLSAGMHPDKDWKRFEENFDFVNDQFIRRLTNHYPWMDKQEKKLCIYIYKGLQTKEIAPLLNLNTRGVEMLRYRMRKKMQIPAQANLRQVLEEMMNDVE